MKWKQPPFVQCSRSGQPDSGPTLALRLNRRRLECRISSASKLRPLLKFIGRLMRRRVIVREEDRHLHKQCLDPRLVHYLHQGQAREPLVPQIIHRLVVLRRENHLCDMCKIIRMFLPLFEMRAHSAVFHRYSKSSLSTGKRFLHRLPAEQAWCPIA